MKMIIGFLNGIIDLVLEPLFIYQDQQRKKRDEKFVSIFGFPPYEGNHYTRQVKVMRHLLVLGDQMPYDREAPARYKEAEKIARQCHYLTEAKYYKMYLDPEARAEIQRFLDELRNNLPPDDKEL